MKNSALRMLFIIVVSTVGAFATPSITSVTAQPRYPWNGKVDLSYTLTESIVTNLTIGIVPKLKVSARDNVTGRTYEATTLSGDISFESGTHGIVWDMVTDGLNFSSHSVTFSISCAMTCAPYCVVDLSGGSSASSYTVTYLTKPPAGGFNVNEYKTNKLALRCIEPGSFLMCGLYETTLTKPFYIGIFEMTQRQYELVDGQNPSRHINSNHPVENVSWDMIRGSYTYYDAVGSSSFLAKIRNKTALPFDLPTEAQWEYACRAGTTSKYNNGGDTQDDLALLGRFSFNGGANNYHATVGSYLPNAWGLYDMHGNVCEWCFDAYGDLNSPQTDPINDSGYGKKILRGGSWHSSDGSSSSRDYKTSSYRYPSDTYYDYVSIYGFRLSLTPTTSRTTYVGSSAAVPVNSTAILSNVFAQPRYPWNGVVDISYYVSAEVAQMAQEQGFIPSLRVTAANGDTGETFAASALSGDKSLAAGTHSIVWDLAADGLDFISSNVVITVMCDITPATYCVIDLSAGANASSYPITYLAEPPSGGFNVDAYKTTKLVLRRIEPGTFIMGGQYQTTLTKPYYIGIFEMTQKQYQLVTGNNPSRIVNDRLPVEKVSYDMIRGSSNGAMWPASDAVDSSSLMGVLRARIGGLKFDLPTEAQWEYACRAGTTSDYNNGGNSSADIKLLGRYSGNKTDGKGGYNNSETIVGSYLPNSWSLYDMHGNLQEWCLDWYASSLGGGTDPKGPTSGSYHVTRGGYWDSSMEYVTSSKRYNTEHSASYGSEIVGFRIARTVVAPPSSPLACADSEPITIGRPDTPILFPPSGTTFSGSLSVTMSCATDGATIHYTTDGTEPTAESPEYHRFRVNGRTTVKAVAEKYGLLSEVAVAEYALGRCADPVVSPAGETSFEHSGQSVSIVWTGEDGVLRYTTDGSDPTAASSIYSGPFTIDETTVVKAKAFGDQYFDSAIVTANLTRVWVNVATPAIAASSSFTGSKTKVTLSCATPGATIRYTLNGNDPNSHSTRYTGPFFVTDSCTVKAYATCADYLASAVAAQAIEKIWAIGDTLGAPDHAFTTSGNADFVRVTDGTAPLGESMKSGAITHGQTSTLTTTVMGPGTITFQWKTSCEKDDYNLYEWDHAEFKVDGTVVAKLDGVTDWQTVSYAISGDESHTLEWLYVKDDVESDGQDCCWVADYHWASDYTATRTTTVPVPYAWLRTNLPETPDEYDFYEAAAHADAANARYKVWECYVAGINPTNATETFRTVILWQGDTPVIGWQPRLSAEEEAKRTYTVYGRERLGVGGWTTPTNSLHRFFKVGVEMR